MPKHIVKDIEFVECPYCEKGPKNRFKLLHWKHLKAFHNKTLEDVMVDFPGVPTMTLTEFKKKEAVREKERAAKKDAENKTKVVKCCICNKEVNVNINVSNNYFVCIECKDKGHKSPIAKRTSQKQKEGMLKKYGIVNPSQLKGVVNKRNEIVRKKQENPDYFRETKEKRDKTLKKRFGDDWGKVINKMSKEGMVKKYGVEHALQKEEFKEKAKTTYIERTGYENPMYNPEVVKQITDQNREKFLEKEFPILLDYFGFEFVDKKYLGATIRHNYKCKKCGNIINQQWNSIQQGYKCPTCYPRNTGSSVGEKEVLEFIKSILPNEEVIHRDKVKISPNELDIYIPSKDIAIEYNGLYYHSESLDSPFDQKYHLEKTNNCEKVGVRLIQLFEDEWVLKKDICKHRLIQILGVSTSKRIHGRECEIKEIDPKSKNEFLEKFHIQGIDSSSIKVGAFYNNELVSIMTFSKGNIAKGIRHGTDNVLELNRFCSNYNYHIPGIASRLLEYFKRNYNWKEIYSYADKRWSNGKLYYNLGFDLKSETGINYWYVYGLKRIHRFALRKRPDEPKDITEKTLRLREGYSIIWDCGSLKFVLENSDYKNLSNSKDNVSIDDNLYKDDEIVRQVITHIPRNKSNDMKAINCIHCEKEMIVGKFEPNIQACEECLSKGLENPDKRTQGQANEKRKKTFQDKYGVDNPNQIKEVKEKIKQTNIDKYGGTGFESVDLAKKSRDKTKERFGTDNVMESDKGIKIIKESFVNKYGVDNPMKVSEISQKVGDKLRGQESKLKDKTYEEIHGEEKSNELKEGKRKMFRDRFIEKEFPLLLDYFGFEFIDKEYLGALVEHHYKCKKCGTVMKKQWWAIQQGYRCLECYPRNNGTSIAELEILEFVKELLPNEKVIHRDRTTIKPKELDIYIPSKETAIEYNGLYYHSEESRSFNDPKYHMKKTNECEDLGIRLIQIFEDEWVLKKEICKHRIIQILGVSTSERVHARNCEVKEIDPKTKNEFLEKFHIQGGDLSSIKLGAFYNNKLISVMTFSKGNRAKGVKYRREGVWELNRFCSDYNYHIPGIASKLLEYFKRKYKWIEIYSYADRRWSNGNLYNAIGFTLNSGPLLNYWYVKGMKRIYRFALRKRPDEPKDISEKTLRLREGYTIIWDCGNLKFVLKNESM